MPEWRTQQSEKESRLNASRKLCDGKLFLSHDTTALLEAVIRPGDRVCLEGDNQNQADHLATALAGVDNSRVHDLHIVQSGVVLPAHLDLFTKGIASKLDFSYSGPQGGAIARSLYAGKIQLGAIHTYIELFARYFVDLTPHVAPIAAVSADREGNLYTGPNSEDTPTIVEATHFKSGIVVAPTAAAMPQTLGSRPVVKQATQIRKWRAGASLWCNCSKPLATRWCQPSSSSSAAWNSPSA
jgi:malonate decarboxylase alpha subunit